MVADLDALRAALGAPKVTLFAVSYGTFVAQQYALTHPGHTRALVLDSVIPYDLDDPLQVDVMHAARRVLAAACRNADCPGDPVADLASVVRRTGEGVALFEAMVATSRTDPTFEDLLPALRDARRGDRSRLDRYLDSFRSAPPTAAAIFSNATHASASCRDQVFPWGRSDAPAAQPRRGTSSQRPPPTLPRDFAPFDRATAVGASSVRECLAWPPIAAAAIRRPERLPSVPTLMLAGGRDLATPLEYARAALRPVARRPARRGARRGARRHRPRGKGPRRRTSVPARAERRSQPPTAGAQLPAATEVAVTRSTATSGGRDEPPVGRPHRLRARDRPFAAGVEATRLHRRREPHAAPDRRDQDGERL